MAPDYYKRLGIPPDATREEIRAAYRRLARRYHPDVNEGGDAGERFNELSDAYEVLHDPARRERYDRSTGPSRMAPVPSFSARRSRRDVPRFVDEEPGGLDLRFGPRPGVHVQLRVRWLSS